MDGRVLLLRALQVKEETEVTDDGAIRVIQMRPSSNSNNPTMMGHYLVQVLRTSSGAHHQHNTTPHKKASWNPSVWHAAAPSSQLPLPSSHFTAHSWSPGPDLGPFGLSAGLERGTRQPPRRTRSVTKSRRSNLMRGGPKNDPDVDHERRQGVGNFNTEYSREPDNDKK
ncbi:hypothetical protein HYFRA_00001056 [Hymenoscyphus fraxineus]|uniref:Uncharacterized protein n=1 Tax=Hymenoscyphus fraxineus TaxID=746836 RepID=A0A9N9PMF9_9HELO|nr:hypothetical protein HYFRA_00001056 [Hymenoscyphus fraxineus]